MTLLNNARTGRRLTILFIRLLNIQPAVDGFTEQIYCFAHARYVDY